MSNWQKRPLRKSQIHYGALDAWVLVELVEKMKENKPEVYKPILQINSPKSKNYTPPTLAQIFDEILVSEKQNWEQRALRFEKSMQAKQEKKTKKAEQKAQGGNDNKEEEKNDFSQNKK